jgi:DNA-binding CsgD family transcriptional regulator
MLIEARGRLRLAHGARQAAVEDLREAGRTASALRFGPVISGWRSALALALVGEAPDEALALAEEELSLARASGLARPVGAALRTTGLVSARQELGLQYLRESVAVLEHGPSRLEHARSLVALGGALRRGNRARDARSMLSAGLDLAIVCGAQRLTEEAQQELLAAGGRRRRRAEQGVESLTASELRVARLAANGLSNVEIAQSLFVSVKTVETHLAHVYGKFGLAGSGSRWKLAGLLGDAA